jgi:hypothetical protein
MSSTTSTTTSAAVDTGNTILPPPRLTGDPKADALAMQRWLALLYQQMILVTNVVGQVTQNTNDIATMQSQIKTINGTLGL